MNHSLDIFEDHRATEKRRFLYFDVFKIKNLIDEGTMLHHSKERSLRYKTYCSEPLSILVCEAGINHNTKYNQNRSRFLGGLSIAVAPFL